MGELMGMSYLRSKLAVKKPRVELRYLYYTQKNHTLDFGISTPPDLRNWMSTLGWCAKAVDALADRLQFRGFAADNFGMEEIYDQNNRDVFFDSAVLAALISACCFVYIYQDEHDFPALQVLDGGRATGIIDPVTGLLKEGYAVIEVDENKRPVLEAYFEPFKTTFYPKGALPYTVKSTSPYPLLVPIIYRPDAMRPFGHSRISRACMSITGSAVRTVKRSEIASEFYSFPQKYVTGLSQDAETMEKWKASMSSMLTFTLDDDGNSPSLGTFQQASMQPHADQLKMFASLFAGETGLTVDDLGFVSDNPSSSEAIKASHENLRLTARKAQRNFGTGFLNVGYLAACLRDKVPYRRSQIYLTKPEWEPIFEPDAATLSAIGDGALKINQAVPGYFGSDNLRGMTGIEAAT